MNIASNYRQSGGGKVRVATWRSTTLLHFQHSSSNTAWFLIPTPYPPHPTGGGWGGVWALGIRVPLEISRVCGEVVCVRVLVGSVVGGGMDP